MARVSVIIPTRNRATLLLRAIESAKQAGQDLEIIVVDDASSDETAAVCRKLTNIVYLRMHRNVGLARARNAGIRKSTGEYIAFLDDDDLRVPASIDLQADLLARDENLALVYGKVQIGDPETCVPTGEIRPRQCPVGDIFWQLLEGNFIYVPSVLIRKRQFEAIGMFAQDVPGTEDWDAWLRLSAMSRVEAVHEPVGIYRDFSRGQMSANRPKMLISSARTHAKALRSPRASIVDPSTRRQARSVYLNAVWQNLIDEGERSLSEGRLYYAGRNYAAAAKLCPARAAHSVIRQVVRKLLSIAHLRAHR